LPRSFPRRPDWVDWQAAARQTRAFTSELVSDCFADPGSGSGDDRDFILQTRDDRPVIHC
jgi:hypothetical protein